VPRPVNSRRIRLRCFSGPPPDDLVITTGLQHQFARIERGLKPPAVRNSPVSWQNDRSLVELMAHAKAFAATDALVVSVAGRAEMVTKIGLVADNVLVYPFVPQAEVLAEADLCFTHGGFGSITDAALLGVPLVVTPLGGDQFFNAYRLRALDAAKVLPPLKVTVERIRAAAAEILQQSQRPSGLDALAESFRTAGGPQLGVRRIEALLS
jgi:MGT family glycosyltransferase